MKNLHSLDDRRRTGHVSPGIFLVAILLVAGWHLPAVAQTVAMQALHGHVPAVLPGLRAMGRLSRTTNLQLAISLPLRDPTGLSNLLREISDPASPNYRHYLTPAQFTERFGPTQSDYQTVIAFAHANGLQVTATHPNRVLLDVNGTVATVEKALHVGLRIYQHPTEKRRFFAPDTEPSLDLSVPVLHISGLDDFALPRPHLRTTRRVSGQAAAPNAGSGPGGAYSGLDFRAAYVPDTPLNGSGQVVGLLQFDGYTPSDIADYESKAGLQNIPLQNVLLDGASGRPSGSGGEVEVSLDIEMVISMATNVSKVIVYEAPNPSPFVDLLSRMATDNLAKQLSCSWYVPGGTAEPAADLIFQEMAVQGQSFFSASGDDAAYTGLINFPGDTPYITEVGGTSLTTSGPGGAWVSESVWNRGDGVGSGGGISTQYPIPTWQTNLSLAANQGSTTKRNVPDVAMIAESVYVRADGLDHEVDGTSCAAPLWAGLAALINQQAASTGQPAIGFLNPALDAIGTGPTYTSAFHDITAGNNTSGSSPNKFYAAAGYDLCTGWGTPAGQSLINALANPEPLLITPTTGFTAIGGVGGPFTVTSQTFAVTNSGTNALAWTLSNTSVWLNASSSGGTLTAGGAAATITVSLNAAASNLLVGAYSATLWFTNQNDGVGQGRPFEVSVIRPPSITTQPTNQVVLEGMNAAFVVVATSGQPLVCQWQVNGTNLADGGNISGSLTSALIISEVSQANVGSYAVVVSNIAGTATSSNALLTILPSPPVIVRQPTSQSAVLGSSPQFAVSVVGNTPLFYQWSFNGTNIEAASNATLAVPNVQFSNAGTYAVTVTNLLGSVTSSNAQLTVYAVPLITSFSPALGAVGSVVNLGGLNFDPVPGNNAVYFGAVRARVTGASATNLAVIVPAGATYAPITETVNGLTASAGSSFLPVFPGGGPLGAAALSGPTNLATGSGPWPVAIGDLDGDGQPDVVVGNAVDATIWVYRNLATNGSLTAASFAPPVVLSVGGGANSVDGISLADVAGEGRLDIVVPNYNNNVVSILQNLSVPGSLTTSSFGTRVDLPVGGQPVMAVVGDLDGDGRPEIITANIGSGTLSVLRNLGTGGVLTTNSFAPAISLVTPVGGPSWLAVGDLDGDGKLDLATANHNGSVVSVWRNLSTLGQINFATRVDLPGNVSQEETIAIGDLDGDGKPDLVVGCYSGQTVSVYWNVSTPGSLTTNSFAPPVDFAAGGGIHRGGIVIGDLDGDGKPDVVFATQSADKLSVLRNTSTPGSFTSSSLGARIDFVSGGDPAGVAIGDLDGDGRPEVVVANYYDGTLSLFHNVAPVAGPPAILSQPVSQTVPLGGTANFVVAASGTQPLGYQWYVNGNDPLAGATNATLTLVNVQDTNAAGYSVVITNVQGSLTSSVASLRVIDPPTITVSPLSSTNPAGTTATFTVSASGTSPLVYQWLKNGSVMVDGGNVMGSLTASLMLANVSFTDAANYCVLVSNTAGSVTSSVVALTVLAPPGITTQPISRTNLVGTLATFSVTATGTSPLNFQWYFNGLNPLAGATNATLTLTSVQTNQAGNYAVMVTNAYGTAWSSNAILTVNLQPTNIPVIVSFRPQLGSAGTVVNLGGFNFDPVLGNNAVYFGAVRATVTGTSATNLVVIVPAGATYAPITETVNGLTASAGSSFLPVFPGGGPLGAAALSGPTNLAAGSGPWPVAIGDLDGDGQPDVVVGNAVDATIWVYRNLATNGSLTAASFAPPVVLSVGGGANSVDGISLADVAGEGRLDIVVPNYNNNVVSILQNLSVPGSLTTNSFGTRVDLPVGGQPVMAVVGDLDGDGRPEIITANIGSGTLSVLRNLGTGGVLTTNSFAPAISLVTPVGGPSWLAVGDLDEDGKLDLATANHNGSVVSVWRNLSTLGQINFATRVDLPGNVSQEETVAIGDLDGDGKPDLVVGCYSGQTVSVYRNVSTPGSLTTNSFAPPVDFAAGGGIHRGGIAIGDLDGDGKPEVVFATQSADKLSVLRNTSTPGSFTSSSLGARIDFVSGGNPAGVAIGDLDGDGRPEVVCANYNVNTLSLYHNVAPVAGPPAILSQPVAQTVPLGGRANFVVAASGTQPLSYQWYFNGINLLAGATNTTLTLTAVQTNQAGTYAVVVTNAYGTAWSSNAVLTVNPQPTNIPVVASFSPQLGNIGTVVNIGGLNFDPVAGNNVVYFGAVRATVTAASATNLVVLVPAGATYAPITETVNSLTASGSSSFLPVFPGSGPLGVATLSGPTNLATGSGPWPVAIGDLDGDGQPDVVVGNAVSATIWVYRNLGTNGSLTAASFAPPVVLSVGGGSGSVDGISLADVAGDGRLDIVVPNYNNNVVSIFQNLSVPGSLTTNSFGTRVDLPVGGQPVMAVVGDLDGDGRPEIITANIGSGTLSVLQNLGAGGILTTNSFAPAVSLVTPVGGPSWLAVGDLDGDGKLDLATANHNGSVVSVWRNISALGMINFATRVDLPGNVSQEETIAIGDLDGDGKPDLVVGCYSGQTVSVYRNVSTPGSLATNSFAPPVNFAAGGGIHRGGIAIGDLDGDGKPDVAFATQSSSKLSVFRNTSTPGSFTTSSLGARLDFASGNNPAGIAIGDLDGDGRPEVVCANYNDNTLSLYHNVARSQPLITSQPTNQTVGVGNSVTFSVVADGTSPLSYRWKLNGTNLIGATNAVLIVVNVQLTNAGSYSVVVTNAYGSALSSPALLVVLDPPAVTIQPTNQLVRAGTNAALVAVATGTAPLGFQWSFNGTNLWDTPRINGSQSSVLVISNTVISDTGNYQVLATNYLGSATSSVVLTVGLPPQILSEPASKSAPLGCTIRFGVVVSGSKPLAAQWWKDGSVFGAQTNATLTVNNFQTADLGSYSVVVTNGFGSVTSSPAVLSVGYHPPVAGADVVQRFAAGGIRLNAADLLANDLDTNGDSLTIVGVSSNSIAGGAVGLTNNWVFYSPPAGWTNSDSFTYTVSDGLCGTDVGTVVVQVTPDITQPTHFALGAQTNGPIQLIFTGIPGIQYQIQYADSLINPDWQVLAAQMADSFGVCQFTDWSPTNTTTRYYRATAVSDLPFGSR